MGKRISSRPSKDELFLQMAVLLSTRSTCSRRGVGCVLVDSRGHVLSTGYNGVPSGWRHCTDIPCDGAAYLTGTGLEKCRAIHAEQNALLQCPDAYEIYTCYVTVSPCVHCVKLLCNTSCERIVFVEKYAQPDSELIWEHHGGKWEHHGPVYRFT